MNMRNLSAKGRVDAIVKAVEFDGALLGHIVWWTLREAEVDCDALKKAMEDAGIDSEQLGIKEPSAKRILGRAVGKLSIELSSKERRNGSTYLFRPVPLEDRTAAFAIVSEKEKTTSEKVEKLIHKTVDVVSVDKEGEIYSEKNHDTADKLIEKYKRLKGKLAPPEVRAAMMQLMVSWDSFRLRDGGGIYFVPAGFDKELAALKVAVESVGASVFYIVPVPDVAGAREGIASAAKGSLESELAAIQQEMEKFDDSTRMKTLESRIGTLQDVLRKAQLYNDALGMAQSDVKRMVRKLQTKIEAIVLGREDAA